MKTILSAFVLRVTLLFAAFAIVSATTSSAQSAARRARPVMLPPFIVAEDRFTPPELNSDDALPLPDATALITPIRNADGSITLPDGTAILPPVHHADGTVTFSDGGGVTTSTHHADAPVSDPAHPTIPRRQRPIDGS